MPSQLEPVYRLEATWYTQWQRQTHVSRFDFRHQLDDRNLIRIYETLNDVRLLKERIDSSRSLNLFEVGCATGDFYRYLKLAFPRIRYAGMDISEPAIERAREKYPQGDFLLHSSGEGMGQLVKTEFSQDKVEIVYSKDVVHHQIDPLGFLSQLLQIASEALIIRCRTRDVGPTELNPERSRQFHYDGWVPFIVLNLKELIGHIQKEVPTAEVVIVRNHMILGGQYNRHLPADCSRKETGTSETAVGIFLKSDTPGQVSVRDKADNRPNTTIDHKLKSLFRRIRTRFRGNA